MESKPRGVRSWWMASLLLVATILAATDRDVQLVKAVKQGDKEAVRSLLKQNVNVNIPLADGTTALAWAAYRDDVEMTELLIRAGAKVNAANDYGVTPLSLACTNGSAAMVEKLSKAGADPNAAVWTGETAFMKCARSGNSEAVKLLLAHGADANAQETREGQSALMWAAAAKHPEVVQALIERGANVNAPARSGFTALMFAAQQGDLESARRLLAAGAKVNEATNADSVWPGDTALLVAAASGHEALCKFLLDNGADPNAADENGFTALHLALMKGLALISAIRFSHIPSAWPTYLFRPNMPELVKVLLAHGANPNARIQRRWGGSKLLYVNPMDPSPAGVSPVGATPFLLAALTRDVGIMRILVDGAADPLLATEGNVTPLMMAVGLTRYRSGNLPFTEEEGKKALEAAKLAVELGADVNAVESRGGMTALHGAAFNGADEIIRFLVEKGAKLDAKDKTGQTPLHKAAGIEPKETQDRFLHPNRSWKSTVDLLLKLGATPVNASVAQRSEEGAANAAQ